MGFNEQQRADRDGYHGQAARPPQSLDEALGRGAGEARRHEELMRDRAQSAAAGYEPIPARYGFIALVLVGVLLWAWLAPASRVVTVMGLAAALAGLLLTYRLRRPLRGFAPPLLGLLGGAAFGCFSLLMTGAPLTLGNVAIHLILGTATGVAVTLLQRGRAGRR